jgi:hypothetical protein
MTTSDEKRAEILRTLETQYSEDFWRGMKARMEMSFFKYGDVREAYPKKLDALASLAQRLEKYRQTKNTEFLMDAANFCMIEFMFPRLDGAHFEPTDSDQSPGRTWAHGSVSDKPNVERYAYTREGD